MIGVLDFETTGVDTANDRMVTVFVGVMDGTGSIPLGHHFLVDPGVPIPEGAAAVHGVTTERAQAEGDPDVAAVLTCVVNFMFKNRHVPWVVYNAPFDLSLLVAECARYGLPDPVPFLREMLFIDPFVLDKHRQPYRRGKRTLTAVAPVYNVPVEADAHDASADCLMAGRVALSMLDELRPIARLPIGASPSMLAPFLPPIVRLQAVQVEAKAKQSAGLQDYFRTKAEPRKPDAVVDGGWPVVSSLLAVFRAGTAAPAQGTVAA